MLQSGKNDFLFKKSYEISYALWRIAANVKELSFAGKIFAKAIDFIGFSADGDYGSIAAKIPGTELLIKFGVDVGLIGVANGNILTREIGNFKSAIFELNANDVNKSAKIEDVNIADIFSNDLDDELALDIEVDRFSRAEVADNQKHEIRDTDPENLEGKSRPVDVNAGDLASNGGEVVGSLKSAIRQTAILERIRTIGNCRLNDLQVILPDASERTIRYDLESLVEQNLIERIGSGGRGVYYRVRV